MEGIKCGINNHGLMSKDGIRYDMMRAKWRELSVA